MGKQQLKLLANITGIYLMANAFALIEVSGALGIILFGVILWLVNIFLRPLMLLITLPINILTLGLFTLLVNTWMIMIANFFIGGVNIPRFGFAFMLALLILIIDKTFRKIFEVK